MYVFHLLCHLIVFNLIYLIVFNLIGFDLKFYGNKLTKLLSLKCNTFDNLLLHWY